jgi:hypothetical protein
MIKKALFSFNKTKVELKMSSEMIQVGCFRCKKNAKNVQIGKFAQKSIEEILDQGFKFVQAESHAVGITVTDEFKEKMMKWAVKQALIPEKSAVAQKQ